jgi:hypothetical protein
MPITYSCAADRRVGDGERWEIDLQVNDYLERGELMDFIETESNDPQHTVESFARELALKFAARVKVVHTDRKVRQGNPLHVVCEFVGTDPVAIMARPLYAALKGLVDVNHTWPNLTDTYDNALAEAREVLKKVSGRE